MRNLKKKVAFLLAFVMVLSLVPMNVFGARVFPVSTSPAYNTWQNFTVEFNANILNGLRPDVSPVLITFELGGIPDWAMNENWGFRLGGHNGLGPVPTVSHNLEGITMEMSQMGARGLLLTVTSTSPAAIAATGSQMVTVNFSAILGGGDVADAHITAIVANTEHVIINQARLARFPAAGFTVAAGDAPTFNEVLRVPAITITERSAGEFMALAVDDIVTLRLQAPEGYVWRRNLMGVAFQVDNPRVQGYMAALHGHNFVNDVTTGATNVLSLQVRLTERGTVTGLPGAIRLRGLFLMPMTGAATVGGVGVNVRVGRSLAELQGTGTGSWEALSGGERDRRTAGNVTVGNRSTDVQGAGYVTVRRMQDNPATIRSGVSAGLDSLAPWHATIRVTESIYGAWDTGLTLSRLDINLPAGARVAHAQVAFTDNAYHTEWGGAINLPRVTGDVAGIEIPAGSAFGTAAVGGITGNGRTVSVYLPRITGEPGSGNRRMVEVRIRLEAGAAYVSATGRDNITATVSGTALNRLSGDDTVVVANVFDPVTVELAGPKANVIDTDHLGLVSVAALSDIVITETAGGRLNPGQFINIGTADTGIAFLPLEVTGWPGIIVEGIDGNPTILAASVHWNANAHGEGKAGWQIRIDRRSASDNPGRIIIPGVGLAGTMIDVPLFDYDLRVRGNAIAGLGDLGGGTGDYRLQVITFEDTHRESVVVEEPPAQQPPVQQPPAVAEQPIVATINMGAASLHGVDNPIIERDGRVYLALRVFAEEIAAAQGVAAFIDNFRDDANRVVSSITAPNAEGRSTTLVSTVGLSTASVNMNASFITAPINVGGRKFLPLSAFATVFGYNITIEGNQIIVR